MTSDSAQKTSGQRIDALSVEEPPESSHRWRREHFIPLSKADLTQKLSWDLGDDEASRKQFLDLCQMLESIFHFEHHRQLEDLKADYAPFDPDVDTMQRGELTVQQRLKLAPRLFENFENLLQQANFQKLSSKDIEEALEAASDWGVNLHVDFDIFEHLEVFARGDIVGSRRRRNWRKFYRWEEIETPIYQRLVIIFQLKNHKKLEPSVSPETIYIKIFKNIPKMDMEMLLPGTRVKMTWFDQGRILIPSISGVAVTLFKLFKAGLVLAFASVYGLLAFLGMVGGTLGYGVKSFLGYMRAKDKYRLNVARNLYYQNLDNNAGVLFRLIDESEEQEFREAILAYYILWRKAKPGGWTLQEIDSEAEEFLHEILGVNVDFEVDDAFAKLQRLGLIEKIGADRCRVVGIDNALVRLDRAWDNFFQHHAAAGLSGPHNPKRQATGRRNTGLSRESANDS